MKQSKEQGFAVTWVIVAAVVLIIIGFAGYKLYQSNNNSSSEKPSTTQQSTAATPAKTKTDTDGEAVKNAAKEHFTLVYNKKFQSAYDTTCSQFKEKQSYASFTDGLQTSGFLTVDLSKVEYTSVDVRNSQAKISGLVGPLAPDKTLSVSLLKSDGKWCIYGYEVD